MKISHAYPPNYDAIDLVFSVRRMKGIIFTYGDTLYVPGGEAISLPLRAHEQIHSAQQGRKPELWWEKYLTDPEFRYAQELPAHRAEYQQFCVTERDREARVRYITEIAHRLGGKLYGGIVTPAQAKKAILK